MPKMPPFNVVYKGVYKGVQIWAKKEQPRFHDCS